jgi:uncharacterized protein GlcG (DUF336 family)
MEKLLRQATIHWEAAAAAANAAARKATGMGVGVSIAVVGRSGDLAAFLGVGAPAPTIEIAMDKAYTAVCFQMPTSRWAGILPTFSEQVRNAVPRRPRLAMFGGGVPIEIGGEVIGAIGVSGASEQQDEEIANAGAAAIL